MSHEVVGRGRFGSIVKGNVNRRGKLEACNVQVVPGRLKCFDAENNLVRLAATMHAKPCEWPMGPVGSILIQAANFFQIPALIFAILLTYGVARIINFYPTTLNCCVIRDSERWHDSFIIQTHISKSCTRLGPLTDALPTELQRLGSEIEIGKEQ